MNNLEYVIGLVGGNAPEWVCDQIADELDKRDALIARMKPVLDAAIKMSALDTAVANFEVNPADASEEWDRLFTELADACAAAKGE